MKPFAINMRLSAVYAIGSLLLAGSLLPILGRTPLAALYQRHQYFELRERLSRRSQGRSRELLFYRGVVANRFNDLDESTRLLEQYLTSGAGDHERDAYEILADGRLRAYQYGKAADTFQLLLDRFGKSVTPAQKEDYNNSLALWGALRNTEPQRIELGDGSKFQGHRDQANLLNLSVQVGPTTMDFVFDTGANISTMTESTAARLQLKLIETSLRVGSTSGTDVPSKLAVAPELKLGNIVVKNVVFLVLPDQALSFPQINYRLNAIVGLPVIEAFGRVSISRDNEVTILNASKPGSAAPNLCLENLKPLLLARYRQHDMIFQLDSGAGNSTFYAQFFAADSARIRKLARRGKVKLGGAGGFKEVPAFFLDDVGITIGGKTARISPAEVITYPLSDDIRFLYGNLGQDLIKQFERMTLDFRAMRVEFE